jgi:lysylphosphatidylglycerol synthetase-like protein (DUF2156 family)
MPRTTLAAQLLGVSYPVLPIAAGSADIVWTAADIVAKNDAVLAAGKTILFCRNVGATSHNVTVTSSADSFNRTGDLGPYAVGAGAVARFGPFLAAGWDHTGRLQFEADSADVQLAVVSIL